MKYNLDTSGKSSGTLHCRVPTELLKLLDLTTVKMNSINPGLSFNRTSITIMALETFTNNVLTGTAKVQVSFPDKEISFKIKKTKRE